MAPATDSVRTGVTHQLRLFFVALQFFTRLPVPRWVGFDPLWSREAARFLPLVGWLIGLVGAAVLALSALLLPPAIALLLSMLTTIVLTGALHEDGWADLCDGFGGGHTRERILEIMRDPRLGSFGVIGLLGMLALKFAALESMPMQVVTLVLVAHPLSRLAALAVMWRLDYVRPEGKAKAVGESLSGAGFCFAAFTVLIPLALVQFSRLALPWAAFALGAALVLVATVCLARLLQRRLGGYTGDCLGAVQQVAEVVFYLGVLALLHNTGSLR
ncbi:MAG: adenosylcobinamide-GDP ribazoletransferase [Pseudomonadota bacterium]|nr:adenosylcobinamide-GDP ribazoletransferase [Pseudomonadota bacterium]